MSINQYIDHTLLRPTATEQDIIKLCNEARTHNFYAVCVNGCFVELAKSQLKNSNVKVAAVIGFPLGAMSSVAKVFEALHCVKKGASEIDMVINIGKLIEEDFNYVENEIREIKDAIGDIVLKVIFENCYLNEFQIKKACELAVKAGADFVKTSTGFGIGGATIKDVKLMKEYVKENAKIKAAGGIRDLAIAKKYIEMGVARLGTSSGVSLVKTGISKNNEY
jgi:deoxyribose-phosphate aldolase